MMNISRNTLGPVVEAKSRNRSLPKRLPITSRGIGHKITDWERFREFAQTHGGKNREMASLATMWVSRTLVMLCAVRIESKKKTYGYWWTRMTKRQAFEEQLKTKSASNCVRWHFAELITERITPYGYFGWDWAHTLKSAKRLECPVGLRRLSRKPVCAHDICRLSQPRSFEEMWLSVSAASTVPAMPSSLIMPVSTAPKVHWWNVAAAGGMWGLVSSRLLPTWTRLNIGGLRVRMRQRWMNLIASWLCRCCVQLLPQRACVVLYQLDAYFSIAGE